jgi:hemoglobin/transferrin/lactoferrin receptor protein
MPNIASAVATLKIPEADANLNARVTMAGRFNKNYDPTSNDPSSESRAGYTVVDLFATWTPGDHMLNGRLHGLRLDAGVDNVTDRDYQPYQAGVSAPGRNFKVLASYTLAW